MALLERIARLRTVATIAVVGSCLLIGWCRHGGVRVVAAPPAAPVTVAPVMIDPPVLPPPSLPVIADPPPSEIIPVLDIEPPPLPEQPKVP